MDEEKDLSVGGNGGQGGQMAQKGAQAAQKGAEAARKAADAARKAKQGAQAAKAAGSASKLAAIAGTPVGWVILGIILLVVLIIVFIGIYAFVVGAWGSITEKLKQWGSSAWQSFKGAVIGKAEAAVTTDQIIEVANYIEEMGYDVEGSGLVSGKLLRESDVTFTGGEDDEGNRKYTEIDHSGEPNYKATGKVVYVDSLYIKTYLVSDNLSYLIRNFNQPFLGILKGVIGKIEDAFNEDVGLDYYRTEPIGGVSGAINSAIGEGLIGIYEFKNDGSMEAYGMNGFWDALGDILGGQIGDSLKIDKDSKTLSLKKGFGNSAFTYKLDGWTGRYGMPLEFLLSVHMATMAPDLAYSMATSFATEVRLAIKPISNATITGAMNIPGVGWFTVSDFSAYFVDSGLSQWWGSLTGTISITDKELLNLLNAWYFSAAPYTDIDDAVAALTPNFREYVNGAGYDGNTKDGIKTFFHDAFLNLRQCIEDKNYSTYVPFLYEVSDHWYRDVYWVMKENRFNDVVADGGFIEVDQEYLKDTEERWTLYEYEEVNEVDEGSGETFKEIRYVINDDGTKKVDYIEGEGELRDQGNIGFDGVTGNMYWSAYNFDDATVQAQYEAVDLSGANEDGHENFQNAADEGRDYLYAKGDFAGAVVQREDGLRGPTNPKIKTIFRDKYYVYDGTVATAEAIEQDKVKAASAAVGDIANAMTELLTEAQNATFLGRIAGLLGFNPSVSAWVDEGDGLLHISVNGKSSSIALGFSKWLSKLVPDEYRNEGLFRQVELNKDALTAFAILENTETLDADYIYKDFKELLVELDYFDKEELRETIVPVFQWMYEETGSAGWPVRKWEKDPVEYGSLIHSKVNLDYLKEKEYEEREKNGNSSNTKPTRKLANTLTVEEFLAVAEEVHRPMEADQLCYEYCTWGDEKNDHSPRPCGLDHPFEVSKTNHQLTCCSTYVSWVLEEAEMNIADDGEVFVTNGVTPMYGWYKDFFTPVESYDDLEAGDLIFQTQGETGCEGQIDKMGHVQICADTDSWYNAGGNNSIQRDSPYTGGAYPRSTFVIGLRPNGRDKITPFEGFEKDDQVLSPVTGRIVRIGTIGEEGTIYAAPNDNRKLDIVKIENEDPENEYVDGLNYIEIEVLNMENPNSLLAGKDEHTKLGYKLFLEDYIAQNCNGYIVRLEGYVHELNLGSIETADNLFEPPEIAKYLRNKEQKKEEIKHMEEALPGFKIGGETYIKEGTVLGKTTDCNMKITMFNLEESIVENVEDYIEIDEEEMFPRQPYIAQEGDLELLANVMHHENCYDALISAYNMSDIDAEGGNKGTGYVIINRALVNYGNYGTTIREQILAPGQYATAYVTELTTVECQTCLEAAEWCLTWDCMSLFNSKGEHMVRNVLSQSGWCFCHEGAPGENCFLYLDTVDKGTVNEYTSATPNIFDEFFCKNPAFEGYE